MSVNTWTIDSAASFSVKHMGVATVRGQLTGIEGAIDLDETAPEHSSVEVRIPIATITTGQEARDNHLRSGDFLAAEKFPFSAFSPDSRGQAGTIGSVDPHQTTGRCRFSPVAPG